MSLVEQIFKFFYFRRSINKIKEMFKVNIFVGHRIDFSKNDSKAFGVLWIENKKKKSDKNNNMGLYAAKPFVKGILTLRNLFGSRMYR